ncbi:hypothetical protein GPA19_04810 [Azoarcus indigens]|uniref:Uncharacterized protein n=1 Tax=Azoarcus indigens TaxID=29545 RepID=A0A4R6EEF2_9RHOO|nr:hypothetical protein [Azoarcus indigens]NMG64266.1 hypothetical protein [Azoarcus indigens]TDN55859.1 hypothetical protein C7389_103197 [Azoarcus indigens]
MKPLAHLRESFLAACRQLHPAAAAEQASLYTEMLHGALVGCVAAFLMASCFSLTFALYAAVGGLCLGSLIGLLLWSASAAAPDGGAIPPAKGPRRHP